ncbi:unnamed protein product [Callosobruchus maculatus]|uniref:SWIM-type domain-containing protein n=1 Tax=Callosobruchus maculatus TaxID=64391 RepID=A0A653CNE7_CALMS|nr:unnamed protein product [Callosobruchus maculatus]
MTESGFVKAQSDNLPKMDAFMVAAFFANSPLYKSAEIRGIKADSAGRENYGDAALGYVQLKREGHLCTVKAKICPEHKVRNKDYLVTLVVNEQSETVEDVSCNDCPASLGGCKHAIAVLMWVHRRSEEPAATEIQCYWRKPTLSKIGTELKYITLESFGKAPQQQLPHPSNGSFLQKFVEIGKERNINSEILRFFANEDSSLAKLGIHQLLLKYVSQGGSSAEDFFIYCNTVMTDALCQATVEQSQNTLWHQLRYGRITASRIYEASRCKKSDGVLVEHIVGSMKIKETKAMLRGKFLEKKVISVVEKKII